VKYIIGSGYYKDPDFAREWYNNIRKYARPFPDHVCVISIAGNTLPFIGHSLSEVTLNGNVGHVGDLINGKDRSICGWSASVSALAMIAYCNETDFVYQENDCLAFGDYIGRLYQDMGEGDMAFGHKQESEPYMECSQSLFVVRHGFIPTFVSELLSMGDERRTDSDGKHDNLPERKFVRIEEKDPICLRPQDSLVSCF